MARSTGVYATDQTSGHELKEDLLDIITDLSPTETPLFTGLGKSKASNSIHQWVEDEISRSTSVSAAQEGGEVSFSDLTPPSRVTNYVQEITDAYKVSDKQEDSDNVGGSSVDFNRKKSMKKWKLKAEYALLFGTGNSGASGQAWEMTGLRKAITSNYASYASGTTLTEDRFNDALELAYLDVTDDTFEVYTSMGLKRTMSGFTAGATKNVDSKDRRLFNAVDVYESDVARMVKLFSHRDITNWSSNPNHMFLAIQPRSFKIAFLRKPEHRDYPATGPFKAGYHYGSLTLEYLQEKAGIRAENLMVA